jgi:hypothetical protein
MNEVRTHTVVCCYRGKIGIIYQNIIVMYGPINIKLVQYVIGNF